MGKVVAVCGMPGSGKGEFAQIIAKQGIPVRSMGDMVRAEVASRNLEPSPTIFGEVAADLRAKHGEEVLAVRLADEVDNLLEAHSVVLIEGMRGTAEFEIFKNRWQSNFSSMAIEASIAGDAIWMMLPSGARITTRQDGLSTTMNIAPLGKMSRQWCSASLWPMEQSGTYPLYTGMTRSCPMR